MIELTQEKVTRIFEEIKQDWDSKVKDSGTTEAAFLATDTTGVVTEYLYKYATAREAMEKQGFDVPNLVDGLSITIDREINNLRINRNR